MPPGSTSTRTKMRYRILLTILYLHPFQSPTVGYKRAIHLLLHLVRRHIPTIDQAKLLAASRGCMYENLPNFYTPLLPDIAFLLPGNVSASASCFHSWAPSSS